tara:strand:+ start:133 stop:264 length:132 start_codon:yes stop_codon:yes gene_type:complete
MKERTSYSEVAIQGQMREDTSTTINLIGFLRLATERIAFAIKQ